MKWTDLTLDKFNELKEIYLDPELDEQDRVLYQIQVIFEKDPFKMKMQELNKYIKEMDFLSEKIPNMKVADKYVLGGETLVLSKKIQDFTVAQWLDFTNFIKNGSTTDNYPAILSVFLIPKGKEYNENYDIDEVRKLIGKYLSIPDAMAVADFFLNYHKSLLISSLLYIRRTTLQTSLTRKKKREVRKQTRKAVMRILLGV